MLAVKTSTGQGRYVASEWDAVFSTRGAPKPPLVWCHGNHGTALLDYANYNIQLRALAQQYTVIVADLGFNAFGNDTHILRIEQAIARLAALGATGPVVMWGNSMGGAGALNYAVNNPEDLAAVVTIIPAIDLDYTAYSPANAAGPYIDAAYPPAFDDTNPDHAAHNPIIFATDIPDTLPVGLWYSSNDPVCLPAKATAFEAARPATDTVNFGAHGHGGIDVATPLALEWLASL